MRAALIQIPVTGNKEENIATACRELREATGADIAVLPEMVC